MANIYPKDISEQYLASIFQGEAKTLLLLARELSNDYTVFHSVHWSNETSRYTEIGEVDFIVINPAGDILLIEQKNGAMQEQGGRLLKEYGHQNKSKDVMEQITRSQDKVFKKFQAQNARKKPNIDYLIYCPDYRVQNVEGLRIDANRIVDANTSGGLVRKIETILGKGETIDKEWTIQVKNILRNCYDLTPDIHAFKTAQDENYIKLSSGLVEFVGNLEMHPFRLKVKGTAGCGKSTLASRFYENALLQNKKPLLLCFNRMLANSYSNALNGRGMINTWYGFVVEYLKAVGCKAPDFSQAFSNKTFWPDLVNSVIETTVPDNWLFDTIIVDEGQDFTQDWREILNFFVKSNTDILWLEDEKQNLWDKKIDMAEDFIIYHAKQNYRNPQLIAEFIKNTLEIDFENRNFLPGMPVKVMEYRDDNEQNQLLSDAVLALKKEGFKPQDIVVLTTQGLKKSPVYALESLAKEKLIKFTGEYTAAKEQAFTEGTLVFDTIFRFKGQQAPAVIVVDVDPDSAKEDYSRKLLYTCFTRANISLTILAKKNNAYNQRFLKNNN